MKLYNISLQSIRRRKARTAFLLTGLVLAIASFVTLYVVSENVNKSVASNIDELGANIIITPQSNKLNLNYAGLSIGGLTINQGQLNQDDLEKIKSIKNYENLRIISPKLFVPVSVMLYEATSTKNESDAIITGVDFKEETRLKKWWQINGTVPEESNDKLAGAVAGSDAAKALSLKLNQKIKINGKDFIVTGILNTTGSQDDELIFIDLKKAQALSGTNNLSMIEIAARCYDCPVEEITRQISEKLPRAKVTAIKQSIETKMTAVHKFEHFSFGISAVILVISLLIVFTNINASVNERTKEIGIFMAVGFKRWHIIKVILFEVCFAALAAGILGFILGIAAAKVIAPILAMDENIKINFSYLLLIASAVLAVLAGVAAGIYPALKASRLDPTVAFRTL